MSKKKTHEEFLEELHEKNKWYREGWFTVVGKYVNTDTKIEVETKYGRCSIQPNEMLGKCARPHIRSAIDKTSYWINIANECHNFKYDYSKVVHKTNRDNVIIICPIHGEFKQTSATHLKSQGCSICAHSNDKLRDSFKDFVTKATKMHKDRYYYPDTDYKNARTKIGIGCYVHGVFYQDPHVHTTGSGCPKCNKKGENYKGSGWSLSQWKRRGEGSKNFDSFKVYIIKCWSENEEFYKIGITFRTVNTRFAGGAEIMPYKIEVVEIIEGDAPFIFKLERELHRLFKPFKYVPNKEFKGKYECFSKINLEDIKKCVSLQE